MMKNRLKIANPYTKLTGSLIMVVVLACLLSTVFSPV